MSPKTSRKATTSTMEGPEKMQPRSSKRDFFELRGGNGPPPQNFRDLTCPKSGRQSTASIVSSGNLPLAAFEVTPYGRF
jgi:hypothetical protein